MALEQADDRARDGPRRDEAAAAGVDVPHEGVGGGAGVDGGADDVGGGVAGRGVGEEEEHSGVGVAAIAIAIAAFATTTTVAAAIASDDAALLPVPLLLRDAEQQDLVERDVPRAEVLDKVRHRVHLAVLRLEREVAEPRADQSFLGRARRRRRRGERVGEHDGDVDVEGTRGLDPGAEPVLEQLAGYPSLLEEEEGRGGRRKTREEFFFRERSGV